MPVPVTGDGRRGLGLAIGRLRGSLVARSLQRLIQLALDHGLDKAAHAFAHLRLDRVEPIVEKIHRRSGDRLRGIRLRDIARHGVVSCPTLQRRVIRG